MNERMRLLKQRNREIRQKKRAEASNEANKLDNMDSAEFFTEFDLDTNDLLHAAMSNSNTPIPTPRSPITKPRSPIRKPRSPISKPRSPIRKPRSPISEPRSPIPKPRSPISKPRSPIYKPRSPISKPRSPIRKPHSPISKPKSPNPKTKVSNPKVPNPKVPIPNAKVPIPNPKVPIPNIKIPIPVPKIPIPKIIIPNCNKNGGMCGSLLCPADTDDDQLRNLLKEFDLEIVYGHLKAANVTYRSLCYMRCKDMQEAIPPLGLRMEFREKLLQWKKSKVNLFFNPMTNIYACMSNHCRTCNVCDKP